MQHPDYNGHKVFCGCNDEWFDHEVQTVIEDASCHRCPDCNYNPWYYIGKSRQPPSSLRLTFTIDHPGESAAGLSFFTDTVTVEVESGNPGGEEGEFADYMVQCLREWYDGAKVDRREG